MNFVYLCEVPFGFGDGFVETDRNDANRAATLLVSSCESHEDEEHFTYAYGFVRPATVLPASIEGLYMYLLVFNDSGSPAARDIKDAHVYSYYDDIDELSEQVEMMVKLHHDIDDMWVFYGTDMGRYFTRPVCFAADVRKFNETCKLIDKVAEFMEKGGLSRK